MAEDAVVKEAVVMVLAFIGLVVVAIAAAVMLVLAVNRVLDWWQYRREYRALYDREPWTDPLVRWISAPRDKQPPES